MIKRAIGILIILTIMLAAAFVMSKTMTDPDWLDSQIHNLTVTGQDLFSKAQVYIDKGQEMLQDALNSAKKTS